MPNRNPVKQFFITFPKSNIDKVEFRDSLLRFEPSYYKVCEEQHKDGTPHLHAVVKFKNKYSKAFVLKYFKEKYPEDYKRIDVEIVRSIKNSITYLSKEDDNPLESGEFVDSRNPQSGALLKFVMKLGYDSMEEFHKTYKEEKQYEEAFIKSVWDKLTIISKTLNLGEEEFVETLKPEMSHKQFVSFKNFFQENRITKDDMTNISKVLDLTIKL